MSIVLGLEVRVFLLRVFVRNREGYIGFRVEFFIVLWGSSVEFWVVILWRERGGGCYGRREVCGGG